MDNDEKWFIASLDKRDLPEAELSSCIDVVAVLLSLDALPPLLRILKDASCSLTIREQAAQAICKIGPEYAGAALAQCKRSHSRQLRELAKIALGGTLIYRKVRRPKSHELVKSA